MGKKVLFHNIDFGAYKSRLVRTIHRASGLQTLDQSGDEEINCVL